MNYKVYIHLSNDFNFKHLDRLHLVLATLKMCILSSFHCGMKMPHEEPHERKGFFFAVFASYAKAVENNAAIIATKRSRQIN
jgi:hypothetical protein